MSNSRKEWDKKGAQKQQNERGKDRDYNIDHSTRGKWIIFITLQCGRDVISFLACPPQFSKLHPQGRLKDFYRTYGILKCLL